MWIATFHSDSDYEKAKKVLSSAGHRETWIGYKDDFIKSYAWSDYEDKYIINVGDSSCYDFENWRGDEPKIENMGENCAYVWAPQHNAWKSEWVMGDCEERKDYMCRGSYMFHDRGIVCDPNTWKCWSDEENKEYKWEETYPYKEYTRW